MTPRGQDPERAGTRASRKRDPGAGGKDRPRLWGWGRVNLVLLGLALAAIVAGYVLLDRGSITAAPVLLVLGYAVLLPAGIMIGKGGDGREGGEG